MTPRAAAIAAIASPLSDDAETVRALSELFDAYLA